MSARGPKRAKRASPSAVAQTGRKLGPRALATRQRLLDATARLLKERSVLDISVVEIARQAETSPATFYHYFKDVDSAVLLLAEQAAAEMPALLDIIDGSWRGRQGLERSRALVSAFIEHWDEHHAVLLMRNLAADNGDPRFQKVRRMALKPVLDRLAEVIAQARDAGRISPSIHPHVAAAALAAMLERLSAHYRELQTFRVTREELIESCARMVYQTIAGRSAS
ncbi:MAG: TetR/AcrR family transcriptional regulator [Deltaproteobacteria bacterium]|nr:TetR/AcrR family transcriptional regulator [Deltaproteobacteria bacterium]MBW2418073.1 TetR/AcrR family transcriptional regulator [Deltaproteobacteria bacterium]